MNDDSSLLEEAWYCPCYDQFRMRDWEDEFFLFNQASGDTHLLNPLSIEILRLLKYEKLSAVSLIYKLQRVFESIDSELKADNLVNYLQRFEAMGLIVSCQSCD